MSADSKTAGWQHEIAGWVLCTTVPASLTGAFAIYLKLGKPTDIETTWWFYCGAVSLSALSGFATWTLGVFVHRKAKRRPSQQPNN